MRRYLLGRISALAFAVSVAASGYAASQDVLVFSDLHYDPFNPSASPNAIGKYGRDAPPELVNGAFVAARKTLPSPKAVLLTGDFLGHDWKKRYQRTHPGHSDADFRAFTERALKNIVAMISGRFPNAPILTAVGNDDSLCGDYAMSPQNDLLPVFAKILAPYSGLNPAEAQAYSKEFASGGYTSLRMPGTKRERLIILNSVFFARHYQDTCGGGSSTDPGKRQLAWLKEALKRAETNKEGVWLLMHVPPGIDANASSQAGHGVLFWKPEFHDEFSDLMSRYGSRVRFAFASHTHMDEERLISAGNQRIPLKLLPAVSPIFKNNPAYSTFRLTQASGGSWYVEDYQVYALSRLPVTSNVVTNAWPAEYSFRTAFGALGYANADGFAAIAARVGGTGFTGSRYWKFFDAGSGLGTPRPATGADQSVWWRCAMVNMDTVSYDACIQHH